MTNTERLGQVAALEKPNQICRRQKKLRKMEITASLILLAIRRAQAGLYYCLGDPFIINTIIFGNLTGESEKTDSCLNALTSLEMLIQEVAISANPNGVERLMEKSENIVKLLSEIVNEMLNL
ncbi:MAG: hypothetical protein ABIH76_05225 [Candidatus Bathyarchaeota archaeon]